MGFHQLTKRFGATNRTPSEISLPWCLPEFEMNVNSASGGQVAKGLGARLKEKKNNEGRNVRNVAQGYVSSENTVERSDEGSWKVLNNDVK